MKAPVGVLAVAFAVGIGLFWLLHPPAILLIAAGLVWLGVGVWGRRNPAVSHVCLIGLALLLGAWRACVDLQVCARSIERVLTQESRPIVCEGILMSDLQWRRAASGWMQRRGELSLKRIRTREDWVPAQGKLVLQLPARIPEMAYGEKLRLYGEVRRPKESRWFWKEKIAGMLTVSDPIGVQVLPSSQGPWVSYRRWVNRIREDFRWIADSQLGPLEAGYWKMLLLGEGRAIPLEQQEAFRRTGTIHVLVVSGFHVQMVGLMVGILLTFLRIPRKVRYGLLIGILVTYCFLTGANPPIVRATVMGVLFCGAAWLGQKRAIWNFLGAGALFILLWDPRALADPSFQLSFTAVVGVMGVAPWLEQKLKNRDSSSSVPIFRFGWLVKGVAASVGAWMLLLPFIAWHFHAITPMALIANLVVVPWASLMLMAGFLMLIFAWLFPMGTPLFAASFSGLCHGLAGFVLFLSQLPGSSFQW